MFICIGADRGWDQALTTGEMIHYPCTLGIHILIDVLFVHLLEEVLEVVQQVFLLAVAEVVVTGERHILAVGGLSDNNTAA